MRILTGIQSTDLPHLGNILGAILPALQLSNRSTMPGLFFIANLHALTAQPAPDHHRQIIQTNAAVWLACGLDPEKDILYRQSHLPLVCELAWYLSCLSPYTSLTRAHAFKEKAKHLHEINAGLFIYPILMAADILLYKASHIPVGKDQLQHIEMARDLAKRFNNQYGNVLTIPHPYFQKDTPTVSGTDGRKMSKSYHNTLSPFMEEKELYKAIFSIPTDSTPLDSPKDPTKCNIFKLYSLIASPDEIAMMKQSYIDGGYGYGKAKKALFESMIKKFAKQRVLFKQYMQNTKKLETILTWGEAKARHIAETTLSNVRQALGFT